MNNNTDSHQSKSLTLMGFDYGTKSIGIAVAETITQHSKPLGAIKTKAGEIDWDSIKKYIDQWSPQILIVGIPLQMDGSRQTLTDLAHAFAQALTDRFHLPTYEIDERMTTLAARSQLFEEQGYRGLQKNAVDARSAVIMLEDWMKLNV
jgi:putative holliday junction resolvase